MARLIVIAALLAVSLAAQTRTFDVMTAGIDDIQSAVDAGALSYEHLVELYLARIAAFNQRGPALHAIITVNPAALDEARALDEERRRSGRRSRLHGIALAIKDNIDVAGLPVTGGNEAMASARPALDATAIDKLRRAGAIVIAKTNLDELALGSRGYSTVGGQTLNPFDLSRDPGGSSGGTAVSVASGFAAAGIGTETGFSIRSPASNTAIVGMVPSRGLISRAGVIPISFTQDRVGVHARTVDDAATILEIMRGFDASDLSTSITLTTPASTLRPSPAAAGKRVAILTDMFRSGDQFEKVNRIVRSQVDALKKAGIDVVDGVSTGDNIIAMMPDLRVNNFELRPAFDAYLLRRGASAPVKSFADLVATGKFLKGGTLELRFQETMKIGDLDSNEDYHRRLAAQQRVRDLLVAVMDRHNADALFYPVKSLTAPPIGTSDDGIRDNNISAVTGLPAIVVPAAIDAAGLPIAVEFLGRPMSERTLGSIAAAYQRANPLRAVPATTPRLPADVIRY